MSTWPYPGPADVLHLLAYALFGACLLIFVRRRTPAHDWGAILDAAVVTIGVASVVWALVLSSVTGDPTLSTWEKAVSAAYPVAGIILFGLVVRLVLTTGLGVAANALIALATTVLLVGDGLYVLRAARGLVPERQRARRRPGLPCPCSGQRLRSIRPCGG